MSWDGLRFSLVRAMGLARRASTSLRQRGLASTLRRIGDHVRPTPRPRSTALYYPASRPFAPFALATSDAPRASIVIPVFNQVEHTLTCLRALAEHPPSTPHEVVVVDDASSDATATLMPQITGLRHVRRAANGGFIDACNDGASVARGDVLVFLNNDTVPQPGWLEALLSTFDTHPDTGIVGAKLVYPDGRLQEAGGIVFADGSAWNYGRFEEPRDPRFEVMRETDYVSGAALSIPRALFAAIGGFDVRYRPAYFEDTDLAFAVRAQGRAVRYQPASVVLHCEGVTAGTDLRRGMKAYQIANQSKFAEKWRNALASQPAPGGNPDVAAFGRGRAVVVVDEYLPDPQRDSGSLRLVNLMRLMLDAGAHVAFVQIGPGHDDTALARLRALGVEAWDTASTGGIAAWLRRHGHRFDTAWLCRHPVARSVLPIVRKAMPGARVVFDTVDLHFLREKRAAELANDSIALRAAERTRAAELDVIGRSDVTLVVSSVERDLLRVEAAGATIEVVSNVHDVAGAGGSFAERHDLVFVGGFRHPPNVDAVMWFAREVWPLLRTRRGDLVFHCIGADAPAEIAALASIDGIQLHGHVPELAPFMDNVRLSIAPLRFGAGVKGKVNLSMAHGQPVVATSCAVEGMHLRDGEDVLVADTPQAFADAVLRAYEDEALWNRLSTNGLENVRRHFSADAARDAVRRALKLD
ncbi:glycosyltransferase [Lysobacter sp. TY2-98]|uniref:glycosyltransferase n=1 Tax=Lysobacter sp. TY2-98 TaxID=2290922 RepID=UPI000E1FC2DA|nr:glycosyltransferase [Lysobacter sp. TY2-98]AXK71076.1 glycosyltransferase [Lysobacter sp. TY2-98]